jgi:molecular chaperone DnaK (HSP70)
MNAGQIADLTVLGIINEPTASVLAYDLDKKVHKLVTELAVELL